jgi:hypothetical protein
MRQFFAVEYFHLPVANSDFKNVSTFVPFIASIVGTAKKILANQGNQQKNPAKSIEKESSAH